MFGWQILVENVYGKFPRKMFHPFEQLYLYACSLYLSFTGTAHVIGTSLVWNKIFIYQKPNYWGSFLISLTRASRSNLLAYRHRLNNYLDNKAFVCFSSKEPKLEILVAEFFLDDLGKKEIILFYLCLGPYIFTFIWRNCIIVGHSAENCYALSGTAFKHFKLCRQCNKNDIETIKSISCNKMQHEVAACSSMLQQDMLPTVRACCSRTCCSLFKQVATRHVAAYSSRLQPDMLPPDRACCSLIRTCFNWDRIFSSLFKTLYDMSIDICYRNTFQINLLKYVTLLKNRRYYRDLEDVRQPLWRPVSRGL